MLTIQAVIEAREFIREHEVDVIRMRLAEITAAIVHSGHEAISEDKLWEMMKGAYVALQVQKGEDNEDKLREAFKLAMRIEHPLFA